MLTAHNRIRTGYATDLDAGSLSNCRWQTQESTLRRRFTRWIYSIKQRIQKETDCTGTWFYYHRKACAIVLHEPLCQGDCLRWQFDRFVQGSHRLPVHYTPGQSTLVWSHHESNDSTQVDTLAPSGRRSVGKKSSTGASYCKSCARSVGGGEERLTSFKFANTWVLNEYWECFDRCLGGGNLGLVWFALRIEIKVHARAGRGKVLVTVGWDTCSILLLNTRSAK